MEEKTKEKLEPLKKETKSPEQYIKLEKTILENKELDESAIAVYVALRIYLHKTGTLYYCNPDVIYNLLCCKTCGNHMREYINKGFAQLEKHKLIKAVEKRKIYTLYDVSAIEEIKEFYVLDKVSNIPKIFDAYSEKLSFRLLRYWLILLCDINHKNKFGSLTIEELAEKTGVSQYTVIEHNKRLIDIELLYVDNSIAYTYDPIAGRPVNIRNYYGRFEHAEDITKKRNAYIEHYSIDLNQKVTRNNTKSTRPYTSKFNSWKKGYDYSLKELKEIYKKLAKRNTELEKSFCSHKLKDLSELKKYIDNPELIEKRKAKHETERAAKEMTEAKDKNNKLKASPTTNNAIETEVEDFSLEDFYESFGEITDNTEY